MNFDQFNEKSKLLINEAQNKAISLNHQQILPIYNILTLSHQIVKWILMRNNRHKQRGSPQL